MMRGDELDGGGEHGGIIAIADDRQDVGNRVRRQHEVSKRANERRLHAQRGLAIERAIMGGEQIFRERQARREPPQLLPEAAPDFRFVGSDPPRQRRGVRP